MPEIKIIHGDCLEIMRTLADKSIDLTVTSPPYDNLRTYNGNSQFDFEGIAQELFRVTKDGGVVVWVVADATIKGSETGTSFRQALYFKEIGFNLHDTMIWQKSNFANPSKNRYHQTHEYMFVFSKGAPITFNPLTDRKNKYTTGSIGKNSTRKADGSIKLIPHATCKEWGMRHNVWKINTVGQEQMGKSLPHPAMFPLELATDHIISWSNKGDMVLDPFAGSGTTAIACLNTNRNAILIEKDNDYYKVALDRFNRHKQQLTLEI